MIGFIGVYIFLATLQCRSGQLGTFVVFKLSALWNCIQCTLAGSGLSDLAARTIPPGIRSRCRFHFKPD